MSLHRGSPSASDMKLLADCYAAGDFTGLKAAAESLLASFPDDGMLWKILGVALLSQGQDALSALRRAAELLPSDAEVHNSLGNALEDAGQIAAAEASYRYAMRLQPGYLPALYNLSSLQQALGDLVAAEAGYRAALAQAPDFSSALFNLSVLLEHSGRSEEAIASYRRLLSLVPQHADAHFNLGSLLYRQGELAAAEASFRDLLQFAPAYPHLQAALGDILRETGRTERAVDAYRRAIKCDPTDASAFNNLGLALAELGLHQEAEAACRQALTLAPESAEIWNNLGFVLSAAGPVIEAETCFRKALALRADYVDALNNLGSQLYERGDLAAARTLFEDAVARGLRRPEVFMNLSLALRAMGDLVASEHASAEALTIDTEFFPAFSNLLFGYNYGSFHDDGACLAEALRYGVLVGERAKGRYTSWACGGGEERLRVGIVSGDLRDHSVGHFVESVVGAMDPARIELIAYPTHHEVSPLTVRIKPHFSAWKPLVGLNNEAAAKLIHGDGIHILLDLSGHTAHNRLPVFAWKPAPVQACWLGYCATTGVAEMDYYIADGWTLPEEQERYFSEQIWRLPESYLCFAEPAEGGSVSPLPALANGYLTFGSFNNLSKMTDEVVALWAELLRVIPGSRLRLKAKQLKEAAVADRVRERYAAHGIGAERLHLEGPIAGRGGHLAAYEGIDIGLDPFPYNGVTTTMEALWMGVPVLSLAGERFLARQGVGILNNAGLGDWVAADGTALIAKAQAWSQNLGELAALRTGLRDRLKTSPLLDAARFAHYFEDALFDMWQKRGN